MLTDLTALLSNAPVEARAVDETALCPALETGCAGNFDSASNPLATGSALGSGGRRH
jgi:hypothetical protein